MDGQTHTTVKAIRLPFWRRLGWRLGMGGHAGGGTASRLAVETIRDRLREAKQASPEAFGDSSGPEDGRLLELLRQAVESACAAIFKAAQGDPTLAGMGTTVTAALFDGDTAYGAHVGDSRCYLLRQGRIYQISEDHSLVNEQLKAGAITTDGLATAASGTSSPARWGSRRRCWWT